MLVASSIRLTPFGNRTAASLIRLRMRIVGGSEIMQIVGISISPGSCRATTGPSDKVSVFVMDVLPADVYDSLPRDEKVNRLLALGR